MKLAVPFLCLSFFLAACQEKHHSEAQATTKQAHKYEVVLMPLAEAAPSGQIAYAHTAAICKMGPRYSGSDAYEQQLQYLETYLKAVGWRTLREHFVVQDPRNGKDVFMTNLRAFYGESEAPRPLMLSCHIDTKVDIAPDFVSADDGATAAAALLEIARALSKERAKAEQIEIIFFDGEESFAYNMTPTDGLYGSTYDAKKRSNEGRLPKWQINLDMVGGKPLEIGIPLADTSDFMYMQFSKARAALKFSSFNWFAKNTAYWDDHLPFLERGVDSINLIADFVGSSWWHTRKDDMSRISANSLYDSCRMTLQLVKQILATR